MLWRVTIGYDYHGNNLIRAMGSKIAIGYRISQLQKAAAASAAIVVK